MARRTLPDMEIISTRLPFSEGVFKTEARVEVPKWELSFRLFRCNEADLGRLAVKVDAVLATLLEFELDVDDAVPGEFLEFGGLAVNGDLCGRSV